MSFHPIRLCLLSALGALGFGVSVAQTPNDSAAPSQPANQETPAAPAKPSAPDSENADKSGLTPKEEFSNLPEEKRKEFLQHLQKASRYFAQKRIFETLDEIEKASAIFPDSPEIENLRGSCYVEFRDFDRARKIFEHALELSPDSSSILFNIAEVDFCAKDWEKAEKEFTELLPKLIGKQASMKDLAEFKIMLCKLKNGQVDEARKMLDLHGFMDDTPYYFFAQAAINYHDGNPAEAEKWLGRATRIFRNPNILAPWQDTLIEFGYIKSFYGGDAATAKGR